MKIYHFLLLPIFLFNVTLVAQDNEDETANDIEEVVVTATSRNNNF